MWAATGLVTMANMAHRFFAHAWTIRLAALIGLFALGAFGWWALSTRWNFAADALVLSGVGLAGSLVMANACRHGAYRLAAGSLFAGLLLTLTYVNGILMPRADREAEENAMYQSLNCMLDPEIPLFIYQMDPSQVLFYYHGRVEVMHSMSDFQARWQELRRACVVTQRGSEPELRQLEIPVRLAQTTPSPKNPNAQFVICRLEKPTRWASKRRHELTRSSD
jgi:hypothetical protein